MTGFLLSIDNTPGEGTVLSPRSFWSGTEPEVSDKLPTEPRLLPCRLGNSNSGKVTGHCGAEVHGIDLSRPLGAAADVLSKALAEHCVLFFRGQSMTPAEQKALGRHFGELHIHPAWPRLVDGHPEVMEIYADENTRRIAGEDWHSDVSLRPGAAAGDDPADAGGAAGRGRHPVRQHVRGLRFVDGADASDARRHDRGPRWRTCLPRPLRRLRR